MKEAQESMHISWTTGTTPVTCSTHFLFWRENRHSLRDDSLCDLESVVHVLRAFGDGEVHIEREAELGIVQGELFFKWILKVIKNIFGEVVILVRGIVQKLDELDVSFDVPQSRASGGFVLWCRLLFLVLVLVFFIFFIVVASICTDGWLICISSAVRRC